MADHPELFDHQKEFLEEAPHLGQRARVCLYYKTGAGKSLTSMLGMKALGHLYAVVIAPPATHPQWARLADSLGMSVLCMSHAKFRMKDTKLSRKVPIIADEFHLFGGQKGQGWRKFDKLAQHLDAPIFLLSATPNYNDIERCYCIAHILDPMGTKGGYLQFIYQHCETEQNPFGMEPRVTGFRNHPDAASFLSSLPNVYYLADDLVYTIDEEPYQENLPAELTELGYDRRKHKMVASIIEARHTARYQGLVAPNGRLHPDVWLKVLNIITANRVSLLIYCNHSTIAQALAYTMDEGGMKYAMVTGDTPKLLKETIIHEFLAGTHQVLIGTATLATGTDGMDRVCDTLLILDDTEDDSLRRQLVGRIMPRGDYVSVRQKQVIRMQPI